MRELLLLSNALAEYELAQSYYDNDSPETFASPRLQQMLGGLSQKFRLNYAATPVDVLTERSVINGVWCETQAAQKIIDDLWETEQLGIEAKDLHGLTYRFGDGYLIAWPDPVTRELTVYRHDPRSVRVFYDPERPRVKLAAIHIWFDDEDFLHITRYTPQAAQTFRSADKRYTYDPENIQLTAISTVPNPVPGVIPVFHFRNGTPYGRPEHLDAYGPQDAINKMMITMMSSIDFAGFPQRYALTESGLDSGPAHDFEDDTPAPDFESSPGSTWLLSGANLKVGEFTPADSRNFLRPLESIVKQMSVVTDTPLHYFDMSGEPPSGAALRAADFPLKKKVADRHTRLSVTWREFHNYVLAFHGIRAKTSVLWEPPGVVDDIEFWQTQQLKSLLGVPFEELLREGGYVSAEIETFDLPSLVQSAPSPGGPESLVDEESNNP